MSISTRSTQVIVGEPEVVEDARLAETSDAWLRLKAAATAIQSLQLKDGSVPENQDQARAHVKEIIAGIRALAPAFPHDAAYLAASVRDFERWAAGDFAVPDFLDSLLEFQPQLHRVDGLRHLIVFPMYTQNGSTDRHVEALLVEVIWPEFIARLEATDYGNKLFVSLRFVDFTPGYNTNSAVLFPETIAMREIPKFTWGAIFQDREAARYRRVIRTVAEVTKLDIPEGVARMLDDQELTEKTFVMWDMIHDRSHMRGDLPFDPFMIKQRMPYFLYSLEELRCDLTTFRESIAIEKRLQERADAAAGDGAEALDPVEAETLEFAKLVQASVIFERGIRFPLTGSRVRNYDGLGGQLLFAWLHQRGVLHWTDTQLAFDWDEVPGAVLALSDAINELYWRSIDRPKTAHWLAAYELVSSTVTPNPASNWARGLPDEILAGIPKGYTDAILDDEFPLSMFFEALDKKTRSVVDSTAGITGRDS